MYLVGRQIRVISAKEAVIDPICIRWTRLGADRACLDGRYFYVKQKHGKIPEDAIPVYPRRIE